MAELKDLTKRSVSYSQWYNDLVLKADLAEPTHPKCLMTIHFLNLPSLPY